MAREDWNVAIYFPESHSRRRCTKQNVNGVDGQKKLSAKHNTVRYEILTDKKTKNKNKNNSSAKRNTARNIDGPKKNSSAKHNILDVVITKNEKNNKKI